MTDKARLQTAEDLRREANHLEALARPGAPADADRVERELVESAAFATKRILAALDHCPGLLGPLRPDRRPPTFCRSPSSAEDRLHYWKMCALPWIQSQRPEELLDDLNDLPAPHRGAPQMTPEQRRKLDRLGAAFARAVEKARHPACQPPAPGTLPGPWRGKRVDFEAIARRIHQQDPTPLDFTPVEVEPEGYDEAKRLSDAQRRARHWAAAMRAFAGVIQGSFSGTAAERPAKRKTGRPKNSEKDSATKVVAALSMHHGYEGGSVTNYEPATNRGLVDVANRRLAAGERGLSENALSRFLTDKLGEGGHNKYAAAWHQGAIGTFLALWRREAPERLAGLLPHESGREDDH
jgi:hypothetical protein